MYLYIRILHAHEHNLSDISGVVADSTLVELSVNPVTFVVYVSSLIDNCTIEITEFNFDGGGPAVYFYAATDRNYRSSDAFIVGPFLSGPAFNDASFRLSLPEGKTLDDVDGISVWCADVAINFGDAVLPE